VNRALAADSLAPLEGALLETLAGIDQQLSTF
jgi:hypothetical protein